MIGTAIIADKADKSNKETETDIEETEIEPSTTVETLEGDEQEFLEKLTEIIEINSLLKAYREVIVNDFKEILGGNKRPVFNYLNQRKEELRKRLAELKNDLKNCKTTIRDEEKNHQNTVERKLSLVNILDKALKDK